MEKLKLAGKKKKKKKERNREGWDWELQKGQKRQRLGFEDGDHIYGGYFCNEPNCDGWFHKECAEAPPEINHHPSHLEHPLLLTNDSQWRDRPCDCCGDNLLSPCYTCPTCEFKVDLVCGMKPPRPAIEHPMCHEHSLVFLKKGELEVPCEACKESIGGPSYSCLECHNVYFHLDCVHLSKEINDHPCHSSHPFKVVALESSLLADNQDAEKKSCHFCEKLLLEKMMYYHCSVCNFTVCFGCTKKPPPLVVEDTKTHEHPLTLLSSKITFTCNICGIKRAEDIAPYICLACNFIAHRLCIGIPRVININRHDHRISFTHHLGRLGTKCGVCRRNVSQYYGAYFCSVCPEYIVHTLCAFDFNLWNCVELEGIPEKSEDIRPFKVVGHNLIRHFSHGEHTLTLLLNHTNVIPNDEAVQCEACVRPVRYGPFYRCTECCFILHEKCANLATKKRLFFIPFPYMLVYSSAGIVGCVLCRMLCAGFIYASHLPPTVHHFIDVHCGSLSEPFVHNCHLHPLYFYKIEEDRYCNACKSVQDKYMLKCDSCNYYLCLYCATLPEEIWHMSDEHPLTLSCDRNGSGEIWCDVCEAELDPIKLFFFTCSDCEVTLHVQCALGDFSRLMIGKSYIFSFKGRSFKVVLNNNNTRPFCSHCHSRCKVPVILKDNNKDNVLDEKLQQSSENKPGGRGVYSNMVGRGLTAMNASTICLIISFLLLEQTKPKN
ncbi:hypothetical protein Bca101_060913 [Brassica carinata]